MSRKHALCCVVCVCSLTWLLGVVGADSELEVEEVGLGPHGCYGYWTEGSLEMGRWSSSRSQDL